MPVSASRAAAFDVLLRVERDAAYASELLQSTRLESLSTGDHALATELVMGVLRWRSTLDDLITRASSRKLARLDLEVVISLRLAAYQLTRLQRIPSRAAVHESVELVKRARKRSATSFVNAILRKISELAAPGAVDDDSIQTAETPEKLAAASAHPLWLVQRWHAQLGWENAKAICRHDQKVPTTAIRLRDPAAEAELKNEGIEMAPGVILASARRIVAGSVTRTKAYAAGHLAIQDEASQLVAMLVGRGSRLLDCCAAPGGKTSVIAERNPDSSIIAAELYPRRAQLLRKLAPGANISVLAADARALPINASFDRVLADVPCSGTGTLARNPEIKWRLRPDDLFDLPSRQVAILQSAMARVAVGGRLVYSTCSLEREENEAVIDKVLATNSGFRVLDCRFELDELLRAGELVVSNFDNLARGSYFRTVPGVLPVDGFFAAILERS